MATDPKFLPANQPLTDPRTGLASRVWLLFWQSLLGQAAAAGTGTVTGVSGTSPIASSGGTTPAISLNDTAVTPGAYGDSTHVGRFTVDQKGRLTAASSVAISGGGGSGALTLLETQTASSSASLDFTASISSTYDEYLIEILNLVPATNAVSLLMRVSTNGGVSYDSGANYWTDGGSWRSGLGWSAVGGGSGTSIGLSPSGNTISNSATRGAWYSLRMINPLSTALYTQVFGQGGILFSDGSTRVNLTLAGEYSTTSAVNAFQFLMSSGNIASGVVRCYGVSM